MIGISVVSAAEFDLSLAKEMFNYAKPTYCVAD